MTGRDNTDLLTSIAEALEAINRIDKEMLEDQGNLGTSLEIPLVACLCSSISSAADMLRAAQKLLKMM